MKYILLIFCLLVFTPSLWAQQEIKGFIRSSLDNSPLPGATILVQGSGTGTTTDAEGRFTLSARPGKIILVASFIGYLSREVAISLPLIQPLVISLSEDSHHLLEVVISTGYEQLPRERATGSFAKIDQARFTEQVGTTVLSRLEAIANGVTVDRGTNSGGLLVRGLSTIQGPKAPLIVVDNFPYEGDLNNLNPNDVESITVLKDAAAASIWGARAGNGVIVISLKKGRFNLPLSVEFNTNITRTAAPDLSRLRLLDPADYLEVEQFLYGKGYYTSSLNATTRPVISPAVEILLKRTNGSLTPEAAAAALNVLKSSDLRDQYQKYMYQTAVQQQYSLNLRGGTSTHNWLLSSGYDKQVNELAAGYNRLNLRFQNSLQVRNNLELTTGLFITQSQNTSGKTAFSELVRLPGGSYTALADAEGNALPVQKDFRQSYKATAGNGKLLDWNYYPLEEYKLNRTKSTLQDLLGTLGLRYQLFKGLEANLKYQYQHQQVSSETLQEAESYGARNLINQFSQVNATTGVVTYVIPKGGLLDRGNSNNISQNARGQLNFDHTWGNHQLVALAGGEVRSNQVNDNNSRTYGYNPELLTFGAVDYVNRYPSIVTGSLAFIPNTASVNEKLNRFVSGFANAAYTFKERYTLSASLRRDASNLFGVNANDRWKPLWSGGVAWELSREPFYKGTLLPYLKLRGTYGYSGNVNPALAAVTTISYRATLSSLTLSPTAVFSNYANPELRWETAGMLNLGLDFRFRKDILTGSLEFYRKNGSDLFGRELLDYTSGIGSTVVKNAAEMVGQGVDAELNSRNIQGTAFRWTTNLNASYFKDKVTRYNLSTTRGSSFTGQAISAEEGRAVYGIYSYYWSGLDPATGAPRGYLQDQPSADYTTLVGTPVTEMKYHGSAIPTLFGSLGNTISYKNLALTARISYKLGYYFHRQALSYSSLYANYTGHTDFRARWQQPGDEETTDIPAMYYPLVSNRDAFYAGSSALVENGGHVRFQYLNLSYDLARDQWSRLPVNNLQLYFNVKDLGLLWKANKQAIDPDYNLSAFAQAPTRSFAVGARLSF